MRLGIIGCGWIVEREHAPALRDAKGVEVVAVADVVPERARGLWDGILGLSEQDCLDDPPADRAKRHRCRLHSDPAEHPHRTGPVGCCFGQARRV